MSAPQGVVVAAVDLGASSGRVVLGRVGPGLLDLQEVHRFGNEPVALPEGGGGSGGTGLHWDLVGLYREVLTGLAEAGRRLLPGERLAGIGIDSWAVDYGLLDARGALLGTPYCYRDARTAAGVEAVHARVPHADLYARNGLQFLPFNTLYQLAAEPADRLAAASGLLLVPDLVGYWLTGQQVAETTNASTTGLLDVRTRTWDTDLMTRLGLDPQLLPRLVHPGDRIGMLTADAAARTGLPAGVPVLAVGSHDTASAVVGVPAADGPFGYISSGTWSLVGLELAEPVLTEASRTANFTNEGGVDRTVRYLRNVMGLWLLSESRRTWQAAGLPAPLEQLLAAAAALPTGGPVIDPDDAAFLPPGDMPARIAAACRAAGRPEPAGQEAVVRCILDSLAAAYARTLDDAARLTGIRPTVLHVVGGGSQNAPLCRLTAQATGLPVLAGPTEATALGNVLVQARALGALEGDLPTLRALVRQTHPPVEYRPEPAGSPGWHATTDGAAGRPGRRRSGRTRR